jgi:hypothetical protein
MQGHEILMTTNVTISKEKSDMNMIISLGAFAILTLLWLGFAAALVFNQALLDTAWQILRGLPFIAQAVIWLLVLPVAAGLWIWETSWPLWLRLVLVIGLGWVTVYTFFPRKA